MASGMIMGQTRARISMGRLAELVVPVPPLPLQQTFAWRVAEIRELEAAQAASRRRLDALFESLLHRAFAGELSPQDSSEIGLQHPKSVPASARPATQAQAYLIRLIPALLREVGHPLSLERLNSAVAFLFLPSDQLLPLVGRLSGPAAGVHFASFAQPYEDGAFLAAIKTLFRTQTLSSDTNRHGVLTLALTGKLPPLTSEIEADAHHLAPLVALIPPETVAPTLVRLQPARVREAVLMPA